MAPSESNRTAICMSSDWTEAISFRSEESAVVGNNLSTKISRRRRPVGPWSAFCLIPGRRFNACVMGALSRGLRGASFPFQLARHRARAFL
jgi:hypothetical protein